MSISIMIKSLIILYSHIIIYYEIGNVSDSYGNIVPECHGQKGIYRSFIAVCNITLYSLCPSFLMILFGSLLLH